MAWIKRRLSLGEFEAAKTYLFNVSEERIAAARAALVEGRTFASIAQQYGWSRQAVNTCVNTVWTASARAHEAQNAFATNGGIVPAGWKQVTLLVPDDLLDRFHAEIAAYAATGNTDPAMLGKALGADASQNTAR